MQIILRRSCAVYQVRGLARHREGNVCAAQREILALGEAGYREVTLLGQNVDAYGRDLPGAAADGSGDPRVE